jgi:hypothetical protein
VKVSHRRRNRHVDADHANAHAALFEEFEKAEDDQLAAITQRVCQLLFKSSLLP